MDVDNGTPPPPSPWQPERDPIRLAIYGKTVEEIGELASAIGRCTIQGIAEKDPETGKPNVDWLEDEIADVEMCIHFLKEKLYLYKGRIDARKAVKIRHKEEWFKLIKTETDNG